MYIIELCGLPGCGKTTLLQTVRRALIADGYTVENLQTLPLKFGRIDRLKCKLAMMFDRDCRKLNASARKHYKGVTDQQKKYWIWRIVQTCYLVNQARRYGLDIALYDEGCAQFLTSIVHEENIGEPEYKFFQDVYSMIYEKNNTLIIDCKISKEETMRRMKGRNRSGERFLLGTDEDIMKRLNTKKENIEKVVSFFPKEDVFKIDMESSNYLSDLEGIIKQRICNA